jgi:hypothetical protein
VLDKNKSLTHECGCGCVDCTCGKRNRFFRGKRMKADDFAIEQLYGIERRRIVNRHVIGTGIVSGFPIAKEPLAVGPGFAIDEHGREIVLAHLTELGRDNLFLIGTDASSCRTEGFDQIDPASEYVLSIHYAERRFGDVDLHGGCGCEKPEKNYICETAVFSLKAVDHCPCGEKPCDWKCECPPEPERPPEHERPDPHQQPPKAEIDRLAPKATLTDQQRREGVERPNRINEMLEQLRRDHWKLPPGHHVADPCAGRGPHRCVCGRLTDQPVECGHAALCNWNGYDIDPGDGVALACVRVRTTGDRCKPVVITVTDDCRPRRFVKSNELLYDFIRGCDLTHISWISWDSWHRRVDPVPWDQFAAMFHKNGVTDFVVVFSSPVRKDTIRFDSVVMEIFTREPGTGWRIAKRIPIREFEMEPGPSTMTRYLRPIVRTKWAADEEGEEGESWFSEGNFEVRIQVDGNGILDCHDQAVDADALGVRATPTGDGVAGGLFSSSFSVSARPFDR